MQHLVMSIGYSLRVEEEAQRRKKDAELHAIKDH